MSSFKKSVIFSTTVLAAGAIAILAFPNTSNAQEIISRQGGTLTVNPDAVMGRYNDSAGTRVPQHQQSLDNAAATAAGANIQPAPGIMGSLYGQTVEGPNRYNQARESVQANIPNITSGIAANLPTEAEIRAIAEAEIAAGQKQSVAERTALIESIQQPATSVVEASIQATADSVAAAANGDAAGVAGPVGQGILADTNIVEEVRANADVGVTIQAVDEDGNFYDEDGNVVGQDADAGAAFGAASQAEEDRIAAEQAAADATNAANQAAANASAAESVSTSAANQASLDATAAADASTAATTAAAEATAAQAAADSAAAQAAAAHADATAAQATGDVTLAAAEAAEATAAQAAADAAAAQAAQAAADAAAAQAAANAAATQAAQSAAAAQTAAANAAAAQQAAADAAAAQVAAQQAAAEAQAEAEAAIAAAGVDFDAEAAIP